MLLLVAPTAAYVIHLVAAAACMWPAVAGNVAAGVVVPPDMHCSPVVGAATAVVVVVAIFSASISGATIVSVSVAAMIAGVVAVGVSTLNALSASVPSTLLVCLAQT